MFSSPFSPPADGSFFIFVLLPRFFFEGKLWDELTFFFAFAFPREDVGGFLLWEVVASCEGDESDDERAERDSTDAERGATWNGESDATVRAHTGIEMQFQIKFHCETDVLENSQKKTHTRTHITLLAITLERSLRFPSVRFVEIHTKSVGKKIVRGD